MYCNTIHDSTTNLPIAIQFIILQYNTLFFNPSWSQYNPCIVTQYPCQGSYIAIQCQPIAIQTIQLHPSLTIQLQYNFFFPALTLAIQLQGCNTIFFFSQDNWAVAQFRSAFFFSYIFFHFFQFLEDTKNTYLIFFFHFPEYTNKFIKIYFNQFSSVLHTIKP